ncbi:MAG: four helix bundle protein [Brevundimonas sp.]|jgi:four helix bundle protein|uniref:four helix bundle protein n=1 Tax=Brevundimonas sp. TaxID=1871086 RepID=UPI0039E36431
MKEPLSSYRELTIWRDGIALVKSCYLITRAFPKDEQFGLTSQIRRSAVSVPADVAEGYGRGTRKDYVRHLMISQGSLKELETHLIIAAEVDCAPKSDIEPVLRRCDQLGRGPGALIRSLRAKDA